MKIAKFEFSLFGINTYIVVDPDTLKAAIIDPGMSTESEEKAIKDFIAKENLRITHIINTHLHIDHAISDKMASELFDAPIYAHADDEFLGERISQQSLMFGLNRRISEFSISSYLFDGEEISIGTGKLKVLHVPGHSPGSVALYDKEDKFVITGDALFAGSIGRTDLPGGNHSQLINSIKSKLLTLPDDTIVYPGHGPATTIGREKRSNPFLL
ncbi:MAG: MBL fold metallo-hydrolase [Muribaculaceae bacterium]|nr:MBL fold metallo-hydrolase [Muribaculaceae bacterium]